MRRHVAGSTLSTCAASGSGMWRAAHPARVQLVRVHARLPAHKPDQAPKIPCAWIVLPTQPDLVPAPLAPQPCLPALLAAENAKIPCVGGHPKNIIMLCCDAFGVLPPVAKLTKEQAMYYFIRWAQAGAGCDPQHPLSAVRPLVHDTLPAPFTLCSALRSPAGLRPQLLPCRPSPLQRLHRQGGGH